MISWFWPPLQIKVDCIENQPAVDVVLGKHVFLTVGDYYSSEKTEWFHSNLPVNFFFLFKLLIVNQEKQKKIYVYERASAFITGITIAIFHFVVEKYIVQMFYYEKLGS